MHNIRLGSKGTGEHIHLDFVRVLYKAMYTCTCCTLRSWKLLHIWRCLVNSSNAVVTSVSSYYLFILLKIQ